MEIAVKFGHKQRDITNQKLHFLLIVKLVEYRGRTSYWLTKCDCGKEEIRTYGDCVDRKSCGCACRKLFNDLSGIKNNKITLLKCVGQNNYGCYIYDSICDCGNKLVCEGNDVKSGRLKSCGCLKYDCRDIDYNKSLFKMVYVDYKIKAKQRDLEFNLDFNRFVDICSKNCEYCNSSPINIKKNKNWNKVLKYNGIDRKNNSLGYIEGNVLTCCRLCNQAKHAMTFDKFKEWVETILDAKTNKVGIWTDNNQSKDVHD